MGSRRATWRATASAANVATAAGHRHGRLRGPVRVLGGLRPRRPGREQQPLPPPAIPFGACATFPGEMWRTPRSWVEASYPNLVYFNEVDKGGHFAAWEGPSCSRPSSAPRSAHCAEPPLVKGVTMEAPAAFACAVPAVGRSWPACRRDGTMDQDVTFAQDIRPLFRERDVSSMSSRLDLSSYDEVVANAESIYERLTDRHDALRRRIACGRRPALSHLDGQRARTLVRQSDPTRPDNQRPTQLIRGSRLPGQSGSPSPQTRPQRLTAQVNPQGHPPSLLLSLLLIRRAGKTDSPQPFG